MADNDTPQDDRTEQPSEKRLADARRRGRVPRSRELGTTVVLLAAAAACVVMQPFLAVSLQTLFA
jgi:flagellar biosynthetic protein FlhB